jgi:hypothetical protein
MSCEDDIRNLEALLNSCIRNAYLIISQRRRGLTDLINVSAVVFFSKGEYDQYAIDSRPYQEFILELWTEIAKTEDSNILDALYKRILAERKVWIEISVIVPEPCYTSADQRLLRFLCFVPRSL